MWAGHVECRQLCSDVVPPFHVLLSPRTSLPLVWWACPMRCKEDLHFHHFLIFSPTVYDSLNGFARSLQVWGFRLLKRELWFLRALPDVVTWDSLPRALEVPFLSQRHDEMEQGKSAEFLQLSAIGMGPCALRVSLLGCITFFEWLWFRVSNLRQPLVFT
jgi:hypothetical protein